MQRANGESEKDMEDFDFAEFGPVGFAEAVKASSDAQESDTDTAEKWLTAGSFIDPTGWLSAAASLVKPRCKLPSGLLQDGSKMAAISNVAGDEVLQEVTKEEDNDLDEHFAAEEALLQEFQVDVAQLVTEIDADKDGKISLKELLASESEGAGDVALIEQEEEENAELTKLFEEADSDKDGHLSPDEIMSGQAVSNLKSIWQKV